MPSSNHEQYHGVGSDMIGHLALGFHAERVLHLSAGMVHHNLAQEKTRSKLPLVLLGPNFEGRHGRDLVAGCRMCLSHDGRHW